MKVGVVLSAGLLCVSGFVVPAAEPKSMLGRDKIVVWPYYPGDAKALKSITLIHSKTNEWRYWRDRGVVPGTALTWHGILTDKTVGQGADAILGLGFGDNPSPVACLDEFGFDYGGQTDQKTAQILMEVKRRRPDLGLVVYQMRGPFPDVLADSYRKAVDVVAMECYAPTNNYWWILTQVVGARLNGLIDKSIVLLGIGTGGQPGEFWPATKEDVERQVRFVRLVAPESPGLGFFLGKVDPAVVAYADDLGARFLDLPTDGAGLPPEAIALYKKLTDRHEQPFLVCAPNWVEPDRSSGNPNKLVRPVVFRALVMNLGEKDATDVRIRLRNRQDKGGDVFAEGVTKVLPARKVSVALLPAMGPPDSSPWKCWKDWIMEVEAAGCDVVKFEF